jgi:hypothetical protein
MPPTCANNLTDIPKFKDTLSGVAISALSVKVEFFSSALSLSFEAISLFNIFTLASNSTFVFDISSKYLPKQTVRSGLTAF